MPSNSTQHDKEHVCQDPMQNLHVLLLGPKPRKNSGSHIDASHSRQPLVKGERLVRNEVNAVMIYTNSPFMGAHCFHACIASFACQRCK